MFRLLIAILLLALSPGMAAAADVRIATFNTFWLFDKVAPCERWGDRRPSQTYDQALDAVAEAIHSLNADIIVLQEIEDIHANGQPQVLADLQTKLLALGIDYQHKVTGDGLDNFTCQTVGLFSKFPVIGTPTLKYPNEKEIYALENDGAEDETGITKGMKATLEINGQEVDVFVFHLKSQLPGEPGGLHGSDQQRIAQGSIVRRITPPALQDGRSVIVAGDLNAGIGSPTLRRIRGFDDPWPNLYQPAAIDDIWPPDDPANRKFQGQKWSHEFRGRTKLIDHILLSRDLARAMKKAEVMPRDESASDHFPVVVELELN